MEYLSELELLPTTQSSSTLLDNLVQTTPSEMQQLKDNMDNFFLVMMGCIILFMQAGFAFLEAGSVRSKNVTNILTKNFSEIVFGVPAYFAFGYAFTFGGGGGNSFIGLEYFCLIGLPPKQYSHAFFQATFAATCTTIVSGAIAERSNYNGYIIFCVFVTGVIYPIQAHWGWNANGWLAQTEFHDFAGSGVVHLAGGSIALVATYILGPRLGRFNHGSQKAENPYSGHSMPLISLGVFIILFGFMAFNGGSQGSISNAEDGDIVAHAVLSTLIACCVGGGVVLFIVKLTPGGSWSLNKMMNGSLIGMVSICSGADGFHPLIVCIVSGIAGCAYFVTSKLMIRMQVDDPVDAVAVHFAGGLVGMIASPIFMNNGVLFTGGSSRSLEMLLWNCIAVLVIIAWNMSSAIVFFKALKMVNLFRATQKEEIQGLDILKHNEPAYPMEAYMNEMLSTEDETVSYVINLPKPENGPSLRSDSLFTIKRRISIKSENLPNRVV
ncbi:putative ammonium transporter 1 [Eurytemora carolleeae]|uniref:putative ammonium transporter 1 n=1 Tax=Eurytemora carolleeae TaxID=1294199 RepID=UPI000C78B81F|nr:putative ammonium transporter 1 [Eurytemora carolleeae]|eukprot:XP_023320854.1 putative ammonium transporter 1 [Eurytemora affinis]